MPKSATKRDEVDAPGAPAPRVATRTVTRAVGRPARPAGRERRQIVVDASLLTAAMRLTGRGQSETVHAALAHLTENAAILEGLGGLFGAFPAHPDHDPTTPLGAAAAGPVGR